MMLRIHFKYSRFAISLRTWTVTIFEIDVIVGYIQIVYRA